MARAGTTYCIPMQTECWLVLTDTNIHMTPPNSNSGPIVKKSRMQHSDSLAVVTTAEINAKAKYVRGDRKNIP